MVCHEPATAVGNRRVSPRILTLPSIVSPAGAGVRYGFPRRAPAGARRGGRLAQRESASFTPKRSLVRSQYRPPHSSRSEAGSPRERPAFSLSGPSLDRGPGRHPPGWTVTGRQVSAPSPRSRRSAMFNWPASLGPLSVSVGIGEGCIRRDLQCKAVGHAQRVPSTSPWRDPSDCHRAREAGRVLDAPAHLSCRPSSTPAGEIRNLVKVWRWLATSSVTRCVCPPRPTARESLRPGDSCGTDVSSSGSWFASLSY